MKASTLRIIEDVYQRYPGLVSCGLEAAVEVLVECYRAGGKLLVCGNGGSAADAQHIVGELMKGFRLPRPLAKEKRDRIAALYPESAQRLTEMLQEPLTAISLVGELSLDTAYANDRDPAMGFAQQVLGHGKAGDVLLAISTSGNSENVLFAAQMAKVQEMTVIGLTGETGGRLKALADVLLAAPSQETHVIQEFHLPMYHALCAAVENEFFGTEERA